MKKLFLVLAITTFAFGVKAELQDTHQDEIVNATLVEKVVATPSVVFTFESTAHFQDVVVLSETFSFTNATNTSSPVVVYATSSGETWTKAVPPFRWCHSPPIS